MDAEQRLREKLRKIEALFAGAATAGEKAAAGAAADRILPTVCRDEQAREDGRVQILDPGPLVTATLYRAVPPLRAQAFPLSEFGYIDLAGFVRKITPLHSNFFE